MMRLLVAVAALVAFASPLAAKYPERPIKIGMPVFAGYQAALPT